MSAIIRKFKMDILQSALNKCPKPSGRILFCSTYLKSYLNKELISSSSLPCLDIHSLLKKSRCVLHVHIHTQIQSGEICPVCLAQVSAAFILKRTLIYFSMKLLNRKVANFFQSALLRC